VDGDYPMTLVVFLDKNPQADFSCRRASAATGACRSSE
jgi:hypothetical protein